ncbi:DUF4258 domain-containing protein [Candidatus Pacearchaeota archaeon]|nr:DUF4258 domain-containing protein [Candidatus Pacearchaeota archaeon]
MSYIFEISDKTERKIRLTKKQWKHITKRHPYLEKYLEEIKQTLQIPSKIINQDFEKGYYYKNYKYLKYPNRFVLVVVKYLNGEGFIITAYLSKDIK